MDIFQLREQYAAYIHSFLTFLESAIRTYVDTVLAEGCQWHKALLQLSPAYNQANTQKETGQTRNTISDTAWREMLARPQHLNLETAARKDTL